MMTKRQSDSLTINELHQLAELAGLTINGGDYCVAQGDGLIWVGIEIDYWHPDRNWAHLGRVIGGMAARGLLLQTFPYTDEGRAMYQLRFRPPEYTPTSKPWEEAPPEQLLLAICRAALAATA